MNDTIRLGRIAGVPIGLNWTWAIVFVIFTWSLGSGVFPAADPGLSGATYVAMGVAAALLFFASLLLHELGHAVVARREGITIDGITLWLFGGVARFRGSFPRAGVEFRIAIAGPAVTAVLALAFGAAARLTGDGGPVDAVVAWLGYVNLVLLGFNLLPAFPLDGGRVLRSALWRATGDLPRATRVSLATGRVVAMGMIAIGLVLFVRDGAFGDLWLALIGWFLLGAAKTEARSAAGRDALDGIAVADLMTPDPRVARADQQLSDFMDRIAWWNQHRAYPVVDGERAIGVLLLRDVAKEPQSRWRSLRVRDVMLPLADIAVVRADDAAVDARDAIVRTRNGLAVVVAEGGDLAGVLALRDMEPALSSRSQRAARSRARPIPAHRRRRVQPRNAR